MESVVEAREEALPFADILDQLLDLIAEDADALGCRAEVDSARGILARGTSSARQSDMFAAARESGLTERQSVEPVVDWLARTTAGAE